MNFFFSATMFLELRCLLSAFIVLSFFHNTHGWCDLSDHLNYIHCYNVSSIGRSFEEELAYVTHDFGAIRTINVAKILVEEHRGHITIGENTLARFPNLWTLEFFSKYWKVSPSERFLDIHPRAFRNTTHLSELRIIGFNVSDDTVEAIASLKDELFTLELNTLVPTSKNFPEVVANFTRLSRLTLRNVCSGVDHVPPDFLAKTAPSLQQLFIVGCPLPSSKITNRTFSDMPNLDILEWSQSNITEIEPGSFDSNPKLKYVKFFDNRIRSLPDGLFSRLTKLSSVNFQRNDDLIGLSGSNFTHVEDYDRRGIFLLLTCQPTEC